MNNIRRWTLTSVLTIVTILSLLFISTASAGSATKTLSTNFTLVNIGLNLAKVTIGYVLPSGSPWAGSNFTYVEIPADGGQAIIRQYDDALTSGQGSVVVTSNEPLASMVQMLNRSGVGAPTSAAYLGSSQGSSSVVIPLISKKASTASGLSNSQLTIQNTTGSPLNATVSFYTLGDTSGNPIYTTSSIPIQPSASSVYDLADVSDASLPVGWWGSAVVNTTVPGQVAVVVSWYLGPDGLNAYEGVSGSLQVSKWFIPLLYVRLPNTLSTSLAIQNISGGEIPANDLTLNCKKDATSGGSAILSVKNSAAFPNRSVYTFNTNDGILFPESNWYGGCVISSATAKNIVVLVQHRYVGGGDTGAYVAIPGNSTDKVLFVPLVAKRLANNFATTATIQNLNEVAAATVKLTYTPTGGGTPIVRNGVIIPAGGSIIRNFRLVDTELPEMTGGWVGTLKVESDQPIQAFLSNTFLTINGDQLQAYSGVTKP